MSGMHNPTTGAGVPPGTRPGMVWNGLYGLIMAVADEHALELGGMLQELEPAGPIAIGQQQQQPLRSAVAATVVSSSSNNRCEQLQHHSYQQQQHQWLLAATARLLSAGACQSNACQSALHISHV